jgi:hypothetical protein
MYGRASACQTDAHARPCGFELLMIIIIDSSTALHEN